MTDHVLSQIEDGVMTLTFNRPEKKNAITDEMYGALADALRSAAHNDTVRAVLFLATGDSATYDKDVKGFVSGSSPDTVFFRLVTK